jgi:hypothetical protein
MLIRPDGYVAWVGDAARLGLADALTTLVRTTYAGVANRLERDACVISNG